MAKIHRVRIKKVVGRPATGKNTIRNVGRWSDDDWTLIKKAAIADDSSVAEWARVRLLRAAKRRLAEMAR